MERSRSAIEIELTVTVESKCNFRRNNSSDAFCPTSYPIDSRESGTTDSWPTGTVESNFQQSASFSVLVRLKNRRRNPLSNGSKIHSASTSTRVRVAVTLSRRLKSPLSVRAYGSNHHEGIRGGHHEKPPHDRNPFKFACSAVFSLSLRAAAERKPSPGCKSGKSTREARLQRVAHAGSCWKTLAESHTSLIQSPRHR